jgi:hypothetical protein
VNTNANDKPVEQPKAAFHNVEMAERWRIEASRIKAATHPASLLRLFRVVVAFGITGIAAV